MGSSLAPAMSLPARFAPFEGDGPLTNQTKNNPPLSREHSVLRPPGGKLKYDAVRTPADSQGDPPADPWQGGWLA